MKLNLFFFKVKMATQVVSSLPHIDLFQSEGNALREKEIEKIDYHYEDTRNDFSEIVLLHKHFELKKK